MIKKNESESQKRIQELEAKCEEYLNGWKRSLADYENLKKETEKKLGQLQEFVSAGLILEILPVFDHFQMALEHIPEDQKSAEWVQGIFHIQKQFEEFLKNQEVMALPTVGETFNPELHEAVREEESAEPEHQIIKEVRAGYKIKDEVLRPAQVIIAKPITNNPPQRRVAEEATNYQ